jgi:formylglycine-generating enzyme required for sulfatase activity
MTDQPLQRDDIPEPFESYTGEDPYIFVSYARLDKAFVYNTLQILHDAKVNVWYDEGIPPSTEWVEEIAQAIKKSSLFVLFMSPQAVSSRFVRNEISYAVSLDKNILTIYLEETLLPEGLSLNLQPFQSLEVSDPDWLQKASLAIQTQINEEVGGNLVEFKTDIADIPSIDLGEQLWSHWERAMRTQGTRHGLKIPKKIKVLDDTLPPPSTGIEEDEGILPKPNLEPSPDRTTAGRTRHPWTVKVEVSEDKTSTGVQKVFEDPYAGSFMWIPPGEISIWVPYAEEQRVVRVTQGFWMAKYPVTQEVYQSIMGQNPSSAESPAEALEEHLPVNNVSWLDAVSFCKALTTLSRNNHTLPQNSEYRLPTEVEWEYACRAGSTSCYYFGDDPNELLMHGWFKSNSQKRIHPVGMKAPNPWGLHDLYGNVREWVGNSFVNTLLNDSDQDEFRISRGGGYMKTASECKSASRSTNSLHHRFRNLGFRLALAQLPGVPNK